jgi:phosphoribosylaminoimidazole (AIR) synthetase
MYRIYNCGVGIIIICDPIQKDQICNLLPQAFQVGRIAYANPEEEPVIFE